MSRNYYNSNIDTSVTLFSFITGCLALIAILVLAIVVIIICATVAVLLI